MVLSNPLSKAGPTIFFLWQLECGLKNSSDRRTCNHTDLKARDTVVEYLFTTVCTGKENESQRHTERGRERQL